MEKPKQLNLFTKSHENKAKSKDKQLIKKLTELSKKIKFQKNGGYYYKK